MGIVSALKQTSQDWLVVNISLLYFYIFVLKNSIFLLHICICFIQDVIYLEELKWIHISYLAPHSALLKVSTGKKLHLSKDLWINCLVMANTGSALKYSNLIKFGKNWLKKHILDILPFLLLFQHRMQGHFERFFGQIFFEDFWQIFWKKN